MRTLEDVAKEVAKTLEALGIDYVIVGGIAVAGWGNIRTTRDVDVIMAIGGGRVKELVGAFKKRGFSVSAGDILSALEEKSHFTIFDERSEYHVDAKGVYGVRELRTMRTKKKTKIKGVNVYIASAEDTIANKLLVGSEQDLKDAEGILIRQLGKLDMRYLEKICGEMGVQEELDKLKKRAEGAEPS